MTKHLPYLCFAPLKDGTQCGALVKEGKGACWRHDGRPPQRWFRIHLFPDGGVGWACDCELGHGTARSYWGAVCALRRHIRKRHPDWTKGKDFHAMPRDLSMPSVWSEIDRHFTQLVTEPQAEPNWRHFRIDGRIMEIPIGFRAVLFSNDPKTYAERFLR